MGLPERRSAMAWFGAGCDRAHGGIGEVGLSRNVRGRVVRIGVIEPAVVVTDTRRWQRRDIGTRFGSRHGGADESQIDCGGTLAVL